MLEGARMHRKIQREEGAGYQPEVPLSVRVPLVLEGEEAELLLEGRADGIFYGTDPSFPLLGDAWTIDEIKTTYGNIGSMKEPVPVHLAQAKMYAWIWLRQNGLENVRVRMTYVRLQDGDKRYFTQEQEREELESYAADLFERYAKWAAAEVRWRRIRTDSLRALQFPFAYREGQRELAVHVYHTICHRRKLFLEAPTGTGKTLAVLFPSLKAMGEGKADRIFYLTAKTVTRAVAADTMSLLRGQGLRCRSLVLTARERICVLDHPACDPSSCPRADGHFDRVNEALMSLLTETDDFSREAITACADRFQVCPFELSLDLSLFADVVICDYNHVFDPRAKLRRFFGDTAGGNGLIGDIRETEAEDAPAQERAVPGPVFLIDESHNLVDRGREMFSAELSLETLTVFRPLVRHIYPELWKKLGAAVREMRVLRETAPQQGYVLLDDTDLEGLTDAVYTVFGEIESIQAEERSLDRSGRKISQERQEVREAMLDFYFGLRHFLQMHEGMDQRYAPYMQRTGRDGLTVRLYCVDPSGNLKECMDKGAAAILFSATLLPVTYYKALLGGGPEDYEVYAKTVFDYRRQGLFIAEDVTSRYRDRGPDSYARIARMIRDIVSRRHGNYMAFFPSHSFLAEVMEAYLQLCPEDEENLVAVQQPQMKQEEREAFLRRFEEVRDDRTLVGFCVLGGIFGEGIDLREDRLIGVLIVGTGIPQVCSEREVIRDHFDTQGGQGYDYAYRYPGMNKVLQAAGRVIRTESDVGIVALLDERFLTPGYRALFPAGWRSFERVRSDSAGDRVTRFWDEWL